jgi:hydrogenase maturation protein HypF
MALELRVSPPASHDRAAGEIQRARIVVRGAVQGVGFRPFVYRLASNLGLNGWVLNTGQGVVIEVEGDRAVIDEFLRGLDCDRPPHAVIVSRECTVLDPLGFERFEIRGSTAQEEPSAFILPDLATCAECVRELLDPQNRRYRYPFINCTHCGPRFTIIEELPYDRERTSMKRFAMCPDCRREYDDPHDRRFHAEPNACPACGPSLALWDPAGGELARTDEALRLAVDAVDRGGVVAVKGLGGFLLLTDARNDEAVRSLRTRKHREAKPFAVLFPNLTAIEQACDISPLEARLLTSSESPIVLLRRRTNSDSTIAQSVAPRNPHLGAMLPYAPLHHLFMRDIGRPVVATSGNLTDEPICIDEHEALERLRGIADLFLVHNRPIIRHVDDSIVGAVAGREMLLRRARGYAPLPVLLPEPVPPTLAVGAHLKNAVGISVGRSFFISQHLGDLETTQAADAFDRTVAALRDLYRVAPAQVVADLHPDYLSTRRAGTFGAPVVHVQHHAAHVAACMAENDLDGPVLGVAWDGTGYGTDGTIWGGEFLVPRDGAFERVATIRPFRLPGADRAIREPRRSALALLHEIHGEALASWTDLPPLTAFDDQERRVVMRMLDRGINSPMTTSVGRLFDAAASLCDIRHHASFEGQAAMELEFAIDERATGAYAIPPVCTLAGFRQPALDPPALLLDWREAIESMLEDRRRGVSVGTIAYRFHRALVEAIVEVANQVDLDRVVLTGGCFQNRFLLEQTIRRLHERGFRVYWHQRVPTGDGGIALGQAMAAAWMARAAEGRALTERGEG